jgi:hypothetical protein
MFVCVNAFAKAQTDSLAYVDSAKYENKYYDELIAVYKSRIDSLSKANDSLKIKVNNASTYKLFVPLTFYHSPAPNSLSLDSKANNVTSAVDNALINMYISRPDLVKGTETQLKKTGSVRDDIDKPLKQEKILVEKAVPVPQAPVPDVQASIVVKKPNFWTIKGNASLQFMQAYFSGNWYKGGDDNNTLLATCNIDANYDNKQGFIWTNKLEMKIGFQNSKGDDVHDFKTHADQIRLTNKIGLQAAKRWYYTATLQSWTQFYKGYHANDTKVYSDFMSPFESLLTLGMDYKLNTNKFTVNVSLSPFAGKFKYCDRSSLVNNFGLKDKHSNFEFGSNITTTFEWNIWKDIRWNGRIYYFTDYDKAQIEWENTINLRINKYLTTKLFLYPRFDDSAVKKDGYSYFQFHETLTLGVDISF